MQEFFITGEGETPIFNICNDEKNTMCHPTGRLLTRTMGFEGPNGPGSGFSSILWFFSALTLVITTNKSNGPPFLGFLPHRINLLPRRGFGIGPLVGFGSFGGLLQRYINQFIKTFASIAHHCILDLYVIFGTSVARVSAGILLPPVEALFSTTDWPSLGLSLYD